MKTNRFQTTTHSEEETAALAEALAATLRKNDILLLNGDLGAGKTAFVRGLARGLHCAHPVASPTFALLNEYGGDPPLYHFDLYRLGSREEAEEIGFFDTIESGGVCAVEWPGIIEDSIPERCFRVNLDASGDDTRLITIELPEGVSFPDDLRP